MSRRSRSDAYGSYWLNYSDTTPAVLRTPEGLSAFQDRLRAFLRAEGWVVRADDFVVKDDRVNFNDE